MVQPIDRDGGIRILGPFKRAFLLAAITLGTPFAALGQQRTTLTIANRSGQPISELYVSATRTTNWGDDRLGAATIASGSTFRLRLTEGCLYDLQVVYQDSRVEERMRANLCRSPLQTFTAAQARAAPVDPEQHFTLENRTTRPITEIATAPAGGGASSTWSDNLTDTPVLPGAKQDVTFHGDCHTNLRVTFDNGSVEQRRDLAFCTPDASLVVVPGWTTLDEVPPAVPPSDAITLTNRSSHRIVEVFLSPANDPPGDERLGSQVLEPGADATIALDRNGTCVFTLRAVFEGDVPDQVQDGIDFCPRRTLVVGP